jgi:DNA-binding NarL/FixJ family response regulator
VKGLRVYVADDHPVVRNGLRGLIDSQPDMAVVGEAPDGETAVRDVAELRPDVVVMDVSMPGIGGVEATKRIRTNCPEVRVVALSAHEDRGYRHLLLAAGASGFVLKRAAADELVTAIRRAAAGETQIDPADPRQVEAEPSKPSDGGPAGGDLSDLEADVLRLVARGQTKNEIAERLGISVRMVGAYKALATEKLVLTSRSDIVRYAAERGWLGGA